MPEYFEILRWEQIGALFTATSISVALAKADFGDGYGAAALIGSNKGLRSWNFKLDALVDGATQASLDDQSRPIYVWEFWLRSKREGNRPFWVEDPKDGLFYLAEFTDDHLDYSILCFKVYSTGLGLSQRRVIGQPSPVPAPPTSIEGVPEFGVGEFGG